MSTFETLIKRGGNEAIKINPPTGADFTSLVVVPIGSGHVSVVTYYLV